MKPMLKSGMHAVALGTAGGPLLRPDPGTGHRRGISTAIIVDGHTYLVDCGHGVGLGLAEAGVHPTSLRGIFITHQHSDHVIDLNSIMVLGGLGFRGTKNRKVPVFGPGDREVLPLVQASIDEPEIIFPQMPTPGTSAMVNLLLRAHATDLNDRRRDSAAPDISNIFHGVDIELPAGIGFDPNVNNHPDMEPFEIYSDEHIKVSAVLVQHQPIAPAFAFRFDSKYGSVVVSGDTAPSANLARLSQGCDLLFHEAIDIEAIARSYPDASPSELAASMGHHRRAHTTPEEAGRIAEQAQAANLALHHLVPAGSAMEVWQRALQHFSGTLFVPCDLDVFQVAHGAVSLVR